MEPPVTVSGLARDQILSLPRGSYHNEPYIRQPDSIPTEHVFRVVYTKADVEAHCTPDDCWVVCFGNVIDATPIVRQNPGPPTAAIVANAGGDVTHWFDPVTRDIRTFIDPLSSLPTPLWPTNDPLLHCPATGPVSGAAVPPARPWWQDKQYHVGKLSAHEFRIRVVNTLTSQEHTLTVPAEDTLAAVIARYREFNINAHLYQWCRLGRPLDPALTLAESGVLDESAVDDALGIPDQNRYAPALHIYFE
jgi:hypothetical protein